MATRTRPTFIFDVRPGRVTPVEGTVTHLKPVGEIEQRTGGTKRGRDGTGREGYGRDLERARGHRVALVAEGENFRFGEVWVKDPEGCPQISLGQVGRVEPLASHSRARSATPSPRSDGPSPGG